MTAEIIASVVEAGIPLEGPPRRVAYPDIPVPFTPPMERFALPDARRIAQAARDAMEGKVSGVGAGSWP